MNDEDRAEAEYDPSWIEEHGHGVVEQVIQACRTARDLRLSVVDAFCLANVWQAQAAELVRVRQEAAAWKKRAEDAEEWIKLYGEGDSL